MTHVGLKGFERMIYFFIFRILLSR